MKILILDEHYRTPPLSGGDRALWDIQRSLGELGHLVVVGSGADALTDHYDVVMVSRPLLAARVHAAATRIAGRTIYLGHDLHHRRLAFADSVLPGHPRPASVMQTVERTCWATYDLSVYPTREEVDVVRAAGFPAQQFPYFRVDGQPKLPLEAPTDDVGKSAELVLVFVGGSTHTPNVTGLRWFNDRILAQLPHEPLMVHVVGDWDTDLRAEIDDPRVRFLGPLPPEQLSSHLAYSNAIIAPLTAGAGLKAKVIDALASGTPLIATSIAMQGIDHPWAVALPGQNEAQWATALHLVRTDSSLPRRLSRAGLSYVTRHHGTETYLQATADLLR